MSQKLPTDFNAERYAAAYPDVALSGLDPKEHYLRFGRLMGRSPVGRMRAAEAAPAQPSGKSATHPDAVPTTRADEPKPEPPKNPIIDRPTGFDPAEVVPVAAPARAGGDADGAFSLFQLAEGPFASDEQKEGLRSPLSAYAAMFRIANVIPESRETGVGATILQAGPNRIDNAWFAEPRRLRLMIGTSGAGERPNGWALRAYQATPDAPDRLRPAGAGILLPPAGPAFHDFELLHPLMPVLLEVTDSEGLTRDVALLPFPSLLPGGMHGAELKALQTEPNPMDAFWSLSHMFLAEFLGLPGGAERSITALSAAEPGAMAEALPELHDWLASLFGLAPSAVSSKSKRPGLRLALPNDAVPTISALVSRRLSVEPKHAVGPFLIAEGPQFRPRWSVALPSHEDPVPELPALFREGLANKATSKPLPVHLAILVRESSPVPPVTGETKESPPIGDLTVLVEPTSASRTDRLLRELREVIGGGSELLVRLSKHDEELRNTIDDVWGRDAWMVVSSAEDLPVVAGRARHDSVLTIDDRVEFDPGALHRLLALLGSDARTASASCVILSETVVKKQKVLQPASGGLFPSGVSFASSPRLTFNEPEVLEALPSLTYPVVANALNFTVWRTRALVELPTHAGPTISSAQDIRLGLDLIEAGYRNLCTSTVTVRYAAPYARRDVIDPVGSAYVQPSRWEDLLNRVTVLRELF